MPAKKSPYTKPELALSKDLAKHFGFKRIVGLDEVGRGALAGPLVVAAVEILVDLPGLTDSKALSEKNRVELARLIIIEARQVALGIVSNLEIDQLGLTAAQTLAYQRALQNVSADLYLTDFIKLPIAAKSIRAPKGESLFYPIAAASILAKTYRDQLMRSYHKFLPYYHWQTNVGYGTFSHYAAIKQHGNSALHRQSFIKEI